MKKISIIITGLFLLMTTSQCLAQTKGQNLQIFSVDNSSGTINAKSVEKAFNASGLIVDVNNDMNSIFSKRYGSVHHKNYNLAIFRNEKLISKLMDKYPSIGLITPLSMSIYENSKTKTISISTLSLDGMARITKIPVSNKDLIKYAKSVDKALHNALPNGKYLTVKHNIKASSNSLTTNFTTEFELEDGATYKEVKKEFTDEFEGELAPVGFLVPKSYQIEHKDYDFYDTYSIIRFNAIYPVSKNHPDAGAYAPFSLLIYKKKGDNSVHIAYPSIDNWISDLDISDKKTIEVVNQTHNMIKDILTELTE